MNFIKIFYIISLVLVLLLSYETFGEQSTIEKLLPTYDAYVLADLADPADTSGLMQTNTGNLEAIELLSSWNVTENNNAFVAIGYLKFDLTDQNIYNLEKAELKMLTRDVALSETPKNVVLLYVPNNNWKESDITYIKRPSFSTTITSSAAIVAPNTWYIWDVTDLVMQNPASELSVAITFEVAKDNTQDFVSFYSKEFPNKDYSPYLTLYYSTDSIKPPNNLSEEQGTPNYLITVIISGVTGAVVAGLITKLVITKKKSQPTKDDFSIHKNDIN